jgi:uncharacterized protein YjbI with pentapeptide repeats
MDKTDDVISSFSHIVHLLIKPAIVVGTAGLIFGSVFLVSEFIKRIYQHPSLGFCGFMAPDGTYYRSKTLWDWLDLLIVPFALAGATLLLSLVRTRVEHNIQNDRYREQALVRCFDLVIENVTKESWDDDSDSSIMAATLRANVLSTLDMLDTKRKGRLILFLYSAHLLGCPGKEPIITLQGGNLTQVSLANAKLSGICLESTDLSHSNLENADLQGAHFNHATLVGANLFGSKLEKTSFVGTNLTKADIRQANIDEAIFEGVDLSKIKATDGQKERIYLHNGQR